jgi:hypothetical protein
MKNKDEGVTVRPTNINRCTAVCLFYSFYLFLLEGNLIVAPVKDWLLPKQVSYVRSESGTVLTCQVAP